MTTPDYTNVCAKIKRWRSRLKRAITMIDKLERQKARMEKKAEATQFWPALEREQAKVPAPKLSEATPENIVRAAEAVIAEHNLDLDIPGFLQRTPTVDPGTEQLKVELAEAAKQKAKQAKERAAVRAEKKEAMLTGKTRRMPLTDRAALQALRG